MYKYELINNHYIVYIDGYKCLIDTGHPSSFWTAKPIHAITIDGEALPLGAPQDYNHQKAIAVIGDSPDIFLGLDAVLRHGITIYKNGTLEFKTNPIEGERLPLKSIYPIVMGSSCRGQRINLVIDTGARYGYGYLPLFNGLTPFDRVKDYNPKLGDMENDLFHMEVGVGSKAVEVDLGNDPRVNKWFEPWYGAFVVCNWSSFYEQAISLDAVNKTITIC